MNDWIKGLIGGGFVALIAFGATSDITDDVLVACVAHNAREGRQGPSTSKFCICSAEMTSSQAGIFRKLKHAMGIQPITTPSNFGNEFGEQVNTFCNAVN